VNLLGGCLMLLFLFRLIFDVVILGFENLGRGEFGGSKFKILSDVFLVFEKVDDLHRERSVDHG
jgi:uncharacterized membrane protein